MEVVHEIFTDWSCLMVPRKIRKMSSMNLLQKEIAQIKDSQMVSLWRPMKVDRWHMVGQPWFPWLGGQVGENPWRWIKDCFSSEWFQVILQLCGDLWHLGVGCWHVISFSVIQSLSELRRLKFMATLILVFKKIESEDKAKNGTFYSNSKREIIINESDIDDLYQ